MIRAIVFDLDGTLIDSAPDVRAALNRVLVEEHRQPLDLSTVQTLVGEGARPLIERAWAVTGEPAEAQVIPELLARYLNHYRAHPAEETIVFAGVREELVRLRQAGLRLGICTNKPHDMTLIVLEALDLRLSFDAVLGGDFPRRKPDGEHVRETLRQMGAERMSAVYVGDSPTDVAAARDAGLPVICVDFGYAKMPPEKLGADRLIGSFSELAQALAEMGP